MNSTTIK